MISRSSQKVVVGKGPMRLVLLATLAIFLAAGSLLAADNGASEDPNTQVEFIQHDAEDFDGHCVHCAELHFHALQPDLAYVRPETGPRSRTLFLTDPVVAHFSTADVFRPPIFTN